MIREEYTLTEINAILRRHGLYQDKSNHKVWTKAYRAKRRLSWYRLICTIRWGAK